MFNISQPYSGHYFIGEWIQYDSDAEDYNKPPVQVRFKPQDLSSRGVSAGTRQDELVQEQNGRETIKSMFPIQVLENLPYKPKDKFRVIHEDTVYTIRKLGDGYDSVNTIANLMFQGIDNRPNILFLGKD